MVIKYEIDCTGLITDEEQKLILAVEARPHPSYWIPVEWACALLKRVHRVGALSDDGLVRITKGVLAFRLNVATLYSFDWISIPLAYTQVTSPIDTDFIPLNLIIDTFANCSLIVYHWSISAGGERCRSILFSSMSLLETIPHSENNFTAP